MSPTIIHSHMYVIQMHILVCICMYTRIATLMHAHTCAHTHSYCLDSTSLFLIELLGLGSALSEQKLIFFLFVLAIVS